MILDDFTNRVPTGTNYEPLIYYDTYSDAGSLDGSRFEINRLTTDYSDGILFYGSLELNSKSDANVFRLSDSSGACYFFYLLQKYNYFSIIYNTIFAFFNAVSFFLIN